VKTKIKKKAALVKALQDMGFTLDQIRVHEQAQHLQGFGGDMREQTAEVIIPRKHVGGAANDIGFKKQADGTYQAIISGYDLGNGSSSKKGSHSEGIRGYGAQWQKKLSQRYAYQNIKDELDDQGLFIEQEREENGEIFIEAVTTF
jgi:hypothetical protein